MERSGSKVADVASKELSVDRIDPSLVSEVSLQREESMVLEKNWCDGEIRSTDKPDLSIRCGIVTYCLIVGGTENDFGLVPLDGAEVRA